MFTWELPTDPLNPAAHVHAWRLDQMAQKEEQHQQTWQQRQDRAKTAAVSDRIHYYQCDRLGTPLELLDTQGEAVRSAVARITPFITSAKSGIVRFNPIRAILPPWRLHV